MRLSIIDYGAGNITNVTNAFKKIGVICGVSKNESEWKNADALVLPGVGSFGAAMRNLARDRRILRDIVLKEEVLFLGICLGMQIIMDESEESPKEKGLGFVCGKAKRFPETLPVPQIGWNEVSMGPSPLFEGIDRLFAYFANSYYCEPKDPRCISATTEYGVNFASAFTKKNVFATQFHPEKSGEIGLDVLRNFIKELRR